MWGGFLIGSIVSCFCNLIENVTLFRKKWSGQMMEDMILISLMPFSK